MHASIGDQLHDLVQNSLEAGSTYIDLRWCDTGCDLAIEVSDNGCGMTAEMQARVADPFFTDGRKHQNRNIGLGLAFLRQMVVETGGVWALVSEPGRGTHVSFRLDKTHWDVPPVGDVAGVITGLMAFEGDYELVVIRETKLRTYEVSRTALREALGELETATSLAMMRDYIASQEEALQKG
ncbi:MAG: ATP-binding protein [Kiritimatiellia bacterium]